MVCPSVDPLDGDNDNDGLSMATAWKSLRATEERIMPGDTVYLTGTVFKEAMWASGHGADWSSS